MPWTVSSPPAVAKNWTTEQKRKCVAAANAVLRDGGSDREAIFACIHNAGKSKVKSKQEEDREDEYEQASDDGSKYFQYLIALYFAGKLTASELDELYRVGIQDHFIRLMILARAGAKITEADLQELQKLLDRNYEYWDGFLSDLKSGKLSAERAAWRAGLYGWARNVFVFFSNSLDAMMLMPFLPGEDCLGGILCGCSLEVEEDDESYHIYWILDPMKEHCTVCLEHEAESPFIFSKRELRG